MSCSTMCSWPTMTRWTCAMASVSSRAACSVVSGPEAGGWLVTVLPHGLGRGAVRRLAHDTGSLGERPVSQPVNRLRMDAAIRASGMMGIIGTASRDAGAARSRRGP